MAEWRQPAARAVRSDPVLFFAFGSLLAMAMPLFTAIAGIGVGTEITSVLSHATSIASLAPTLSTVLPHVSVEPAHEPEPALPAEFLPEPAVR